MRKGSKRLLRTGILAGIVYAAWRAWSRRVTPSSSDISWDNAPFPFPPIPRPAATVVLGADRVERVEPFIEPASDGTCPESHPVKAKLASGIYHVPGGGNYDRTKPDRCYVNTEAAEADGLRAVKR